MDDRIQIDERGMRELLRDPGVRRFLTDRAQRVLAAAQADPHDDTYAYQNGLHIMQDTTDRAVVRVVSGDSKGHILEAKYGILNRALDAAGGA